MLSPLAGRTLAKSEHLVYDICRACTAARPGDRPASAGEVVAWLGGRRQTPRHPARRWISLALVAAVALVGASRLGTRSSIGATDQLEPTGEPVDWSETATVLATVQGRVECLVSLPGREAVRFAWGKPKQVEDLELDTGRRGPAPLVPEAQKEGCAQPSPDGKHLVYQGYAPDGRAFAFVSDRPDGSGALPVVPIADPSLRSDPVWLSNSKELVIDIDPQHAGVFSLETRRTRVLRDVTSGPPLSVFRSVVGSTIAVLASTEQPLVTDVVGFAWPSGTEATRFRVPGAVFELASLDGRTFFTSHIQDRGDYELWRADLPAHSLKRVAMVRDQDVRSLGLTKDRLVFVTRRDVSDAWRRSPEGRLEPLTRDAQIMEITRCGSGFMAVTRNFSLIRLDREGRSPREVARGQQLRTVACAPDGATWYPIQWGNASNVARCDTSGCVPLVEGELWSVAVSPSGERLAFVRTSAGGLRVETMSVRGGEARAVTLADALCPIGWSSDHALWVPRRVDAKLTWTEVDVKSGAATGKTKVGAHDCTDGWADPESPVQSDLRIVTRSISQIRSVPLRMLGL